MRFVFRDKSSPMAVNQVIIRLVNEGYKSYVIADSDFYNKLSNAFRENSAEWDDWDELKSFIVKKYIDNDYLPENEDVKEARAGKSPTSVQEEEDVKEEKSEAQTPCEAVDEAGVNDASVIHLENEGVKEENVVPEISSDTATKAKSAGNGDNSENNETENAADETGKAGFSISSSKISER